MTRQSFDLPRDCLLGRAIGAHTAESYRDQIMALPVQVDLGKVKKAPKMLREPAQFHVIDAGRCVLCGAKARSTKARCKKSAVDAKKALDARAVAAL